MPRPELEGAVTQLCEAARVGQSVASEPVGKALLRGVGIATPDGRLVSTAADAAAAAVDFGRPVAVKIVQSGLAHKTDVGGVRGPIASPEVVEREAAELLARLDGKLLVECWETGGVEAFVGLSLHGPLGAVLTVGLGGIWVEILRDVAHRAAPVTADEVAEAFSRLRAAPLLVGGRGHAAMDLSQSAGAIARLSRLALDPSVRAVVSEIDVNPLLLRAGAPPVALDCTIVLRTADEATLDADERRLVQVTS